LKREELKNTHFVFGFCIFLERVELLRQQRLLEASISNDLRLMMECIVNPFVDVNFVGVVCLKSGTGTELEKSGE